MSGYSFGSGGPSWNGIPMVNGIPVTFGNSANKGAGKIYFVNPTTGHDGNRGTSMTRPLATVAAAYAKTVSNNHDVVVLSATSAHVIADQISVSNSRTHFWGMDAVGRYMGQRTRLTMGTTVGESNAAIAIIVNTGTGNSFSHMKFDSSDVADTSLYCFAEGGEYTVIQHCEIYKSSDVAETTGSELVMNGDSAYVHHCTIGDNSNKKTGAIHPNVTLTLSTAAAGKVCRDVIFEDCMFFKYAEDNADVFVYSADVADVERMLLFKRCLFFSSPKSDNAPDVCISGVDAFTHGSVILWDSHAVNCDKLATTLGVFSLNPTLAAAGGYGVQCT